MCRPVRAFRRHHDEETLQDFSVLSRLERSPVIVVPPSLGVFFPLYGVFFCLCIYGTVVGSTYSGTSKTSNASALRVF